jgi:adenine-specific DNA-methyltransferase
MLHVQQMNIFSSVGSLFGNKRRLLHLILKRLKYRDFEPNGKRAPIFADFFAGSGVVSRLARQNGYRVIANDWEPYSHALNHAILLVPMRLHLKSWVAIKKPLII